jgi:hypothetical protein
MPPSRELMLPSHPRWSEFQHRLALRVVVGRDPLVFDCDDHYAHTGRVLRSMGFDSACISETLEHWATGTANCCDCQTLTDDAVWGGDGTPRQD